MEETPRKKRITDPAQALAKAEAWCAYQERCQQEVRDKLYDWGLYPDAVESIISELISRNFIDEERYAMAFAGGKFRIKKWGRIKIRVALKQKRISDYCIRKGLAVIDEDEYREALKKQLAEKSRAIKEAHPLKRKHKIISALLARGFEQDLIRELMKEEG